MVTKEHQLLCALLLFHLHCVLKSFPTPWENVKIEKA